MLKVIYLMGLLTPIVFASPLHSESGSLPSGSSPTPLLLRTPSKVVRVDAVAPALPPTAPTQSISCDPNASVDTSNPSWNQNIVLHHIGGIDPLPGEPLFLSAFAQPQNIDRFVTFNGNQVSSMNLLNSQMGSSKDPIFANVHPTPIVAYRTPYKPIGTYSSNGFTYRVEKCISGHWQPRTDYSFRGESVNQADGMNTTDFLFFDKDSPGGFVTYSLSWAQNNCDVAAPVDVSQSSEDGVLPWGGLYRPYNGEPLKVTVMPQGLNHFYRFVTMTDSGTVFVGKLEGNSNDISHLNAGNYVGPGKFRYKVEMCVGNKWNRVPRSSFSPLFNLTWEQPKLVLKVSGEAHCHGLGFQVATNYARATALVQGHEADGPYPVEQLWVALRYDGNYVPGDTTTTPDYINPFPYGSPLTKSVQKQGFVEVSDQIRGIGVVDVCSGFKVTGAMINAKSYTTDQIHLN